MLILGTTYWKLKLGCGLCFCGGMFLLWGFELDLGDIFGGFEKLRGDCLGLLVTISWLNFLISVSKSCLQGEL